jgi:DNA-binding NarL/FixJ family response regulator
MKIRILLVDDHAVFREGLRSLLEKHDDMEVVGEADTGRAAVDMVCKLSPNVVILDIAMPELNGIDAAQQIRARAPETRIIALSMHSENIFVTGMLRAGVMGYILKASAFEEVIQATRAVMSNTYYVSQKIADTIVGGYAQLLNQSAPKQNTALSPREREVLQLLAEGHSTKEIADRLHVSTNTIDVHRTHIMDKLGVRSLASLVKYAIREGMTSP